MPSLLLDTHAVVWYAQSSPRLSASARHAIHQAIQSGDPVQISAVSLVEITYRAEKRRLSADTFDRVVAIVQQPYSGLEVVAFDLAMADCLRQISVRTVPDMPDHMIAATALYWNIPLVTADRQLQSLPNLTCIW